MQDETRYRFEGHFMHPRKPSQGSCYYVTGTMEDFNRWKENNLNRINRWREEIERGKTISVKITRQAVNADKRPIGNEEVIFQLPTADQS